LAAGMGLSMSRLIRRALNEFIERSSTRSEDGEAS
jgi:hypothetical protein